MRILLSNDDGIEAPGLALLAQSAAMVSDDVWIVAPEVKHTAAGPSLTLDKPITMTRVAERRYSCSGRPADCAVAAFAWLFQDDIKPDLVLAGVNDGRNVGEDLIYSGTLGIAREATFWGVPAIGFSRVKDPARADGDRKWLSGLISELWASKGEWAIEGNWLSINLPASVPAKICQPRIGRDKIARKTEIVESQGARTVIRVPRGRDHAATSGDENSAINAGCATINRLNWFGETRLDDRFVKSIQQT